jgi:hypothetical protein
LLTDDERAERFKLCERLALLRLGATLLLDVAGREYSRLLLRFVEALLLLVVGRLASRLRLFTPLVLFKLSERPLFVRVLAVLRFGVVMERLPTVAERRLLERFTDELRLLPLDVTADPRRVLFPFLLYTVLSLRELLLAPRVALPLFVLLS